MKTKCLSSKHQVLQEIAGRRMAEGTFLPSIRELESLTRASRQTVYFALRELTEDGVLESIPRRGYRVLNAQLAGELLTRTGEVQIAYVVPRWIQHGAANPACTHILAGAEAQAARAKVNLVYLTLPWQPDETRFSLRSLALKSRRITGAMLVGPTPDFVAERFIAAAGVPVVLLDNVSDCASTVCVSQDNLSGAARAVRHLFEKGHRRIGMISVKPRKMRLNERFAGFHAEMHRLRLLDQIPFIKEMEWDADTQEGGFQAATELLRDGFNGASAILALNDAIGVGELRAFEQAGLRIPRDLSLIAIGNEAAADPLVRPGLTTVAADLGRLGELGFMALRQYMRNPDCGGQTTLLGMTLFERDSVRDLNI